MGKKIKFVLSSIILFFVATTIYYVSPLSDEDIDFGKCFPEGTTLVILGEPAASLWEQEVYNYHTDNRGRIQWETGGCGSISINGAGKYGSGSQAEDIVTSIRFNYYQDRLTFDAVEETIDEFLPAGSSFGDWQKLRGDQQKTTWTSTCESSMLACRISVHEYPGLEMGTSRFVLEINMTD